MLRGTPAVQLKGGITTNIRTGASEPTEGQTYSHREADRNLERQRDPETQRDSEAPQHLPFHPWPFPVLEQGPAPPC